MISLVQLRNKKLLPFWMVLGIGVIIVLGHIGIFPLPAFLGAVVLLLFISVSFFRLREMFGFFFASIVLEHVPLFTFWGMDFRWYQVGAISLGIGLLLRWILGRENFKKRVASLRWFDSVFVVIVALGGVSAWMNGGVAVQQTIILSSCVFLYLLTRLSIRGQKDIFYFLPFLVGSFFVVSLYAIAQNIFFLDGRIMSGEVMPGRPNATFPEADWFGVYAGMGVILSAACILSVVMDSREESRRKTALRFFSYELLVLGWIVLILSVARSAWLATGIGLCVMMGMLFWNQGFRKKIQVWVKSLFITGVLAICIVFGFHLTPFELGNRSQSVVSGLQEITIACLGEDTSSALPYSVEYLEDLERLGCEHINLEEIEERKNRGEYITKIYRKDPSIAIRKDIWNTSLETLGHSSFWGIGWGNIGRILGVDERGASLNSSNMFLEFWLGSGMGGVIGIALIMGAVFTYSTRLFLRGSLEERVFAITIVGMGSVIVVANFFNSGHFLAILWVWLAFALTGTSRWKKEE